MGMVGITITGSFGRQVNGQKAFSAMEGGHAMALTRAIAYLTDQLPHAIKIDHQLQTDGELPPRSPFGEIPAPAQIA